MEPNFNFFGQIGKNVSPDILRKQYGQQIPLVWSHHGPVIGCAVIDQGTKEDYIYCAFDDSFLGAIARKMARHGDYRSFSLLLDDGKVKEVSLVVSGYGPGEFAEKLKNGVILYTGEYLLYDAYLDV